MNLRLVGLFVLLGGCGGPIISLADSGSGGGNGSGGGGGGGGGGGEIDGGLDPDGGVLPDGGLPLLGPLTFRHVVASMHGLAGQNPGDAVIEASGRVVSFPAVTTPTLSALTTVRLVDGGTLLSDGGYQAFVEAIPVAGPVRSGRQMASCYDPGSGRHVAVLLGQNPDKYEVGSFVIVNGKAQFSSWNAVNAPAVQGAAVTAIYPAGADTFSVYKGNELIPLTLSGGNATWGTAATFVGAAPPVTAFDSSGGRLIGLGEYIGPLPITFRHSLFSRAAVSAGAWAPIAMTGEMPPDITGPLATLSKPWIAWEGSAQKLTVVQYHPVVLPNGMMGITQGLWTADLGTHQWKKVMDLGSSVIGSQPYAIDEVLHRAFSLSQTGFTTMSLKAGSEGTGGSVPTQGPLRIGTVQGAVGLPDGRMVASTLSQLWAMNPATDLVWHLFANLPAQVRGHSLSFDPVTQKVYVFGGASKVWEVTLAGVVNELVTTGGPTGPREAHGAAAIDGVLYVAGGTTNWNVGGELDDVWALDLSTRAWRKLGTMAAKRLRPAVRINGAELWVVGGARVQGSSSVGESTIVAFDRQSGAQRTVAVSGAWPPRGGYFWSWAPLGEGIVAIDSGDTVDNSTNQLWTLDVLGADVKWINSDPAASDYAFYSQVGASADRRTAYFLGDDVWELKR